MTNPRRTITLERTYRAHVDDVWELWTTKAGIESWWGPDGFDVTVEVLELRPGGRLHYTMSAARPEMIEFMKKAGMPTSNAVQATFTEVVAPKRLAFEETAAFIPGVEPYSTSTVVELTPTAEGTRLVLTFDAMHDDVWTQRKTMGHESQLGKLAKLLESRAGKGD